MARQYSPKSFLRQAPNKLIRRYLEGFGIGKDIKWDDLREGDIEPIFKAIDSAPDKVQVEIGADFREIETLADEGGVRTLIEEGQHPKHGVELAPTFEQMDGHLERAFWTFLQHRDIFDVARRLDYADGLTFEKRPYLPVPLETVSEESVPRLRSALSDYYRKEGRGPGCQIDYYRRGDRKYYFCFLEDYAKTQQVWDEAHELKTEKHRPAFEVILIYNPVERTLETKVKGGRQVRAEVERMFGRAVLNVDLGEPPEAGVVYELNDLLRRDFEFPTVPEDGIEQVSLKRLKLRIMGREHRYITLDVGAKASNEAIYDLLDDVLSGNEIPKDLLTVVQAVIRIVFVPDKKGKSKRGSFTVSHPNSCTLKCDDPKDDIAKACLKRWKIDVSERAEHNTSEPGDPAQYKFWP